MLPPPSQEAKLGQEAGQGGNQLIASRRALQDVEGTFYVRKSTNSLL